MANSGYELYRCMVVAERHEMNCYFSQKRMAEIMRIGLEIKPNVTWDMHSLIGVSV